jgi:hypothetical protein
VGIVQSGSGGSYRVTLYPEGFDRDSGETVTVLVPNIADDESIDASTKIVGIIAIPVPSILIGESTTIYYYQPPVWMA